MTEEDINEKLFITTIYNIFTKKYSLIINLSTIKEIQLYIKNNNILLKEDIIEQVAKNIYLENLEEKEVLFNNFKNNLCKILSINLINNDYELIYKLNSLKIYYLTTFLGNQLEIINKSNYNNLLEIKNILNNYIIKNIKNVFNIIIQIKILSNGVFQIFDSSDYLFVLKNNFILSTFNEIMMRCIEGCLYNFKISFIEENGKLKLKAIIFPYLINSINILKKDITINNNIIINPIMTINSNNSNINSNIITKKFLNGFILKDNNSILCKYENINTFISKLNILKLSPYFQMIEFSEKNRLLFFIENFILKSFIPLIFQNQKILINEKLNWIILTEEINLQFNFSCLLNNKSFNIKAICLNSNYNYQLNFNNEELIIKKGEIISFFE